MTQRNFEGSAGRGRGEDGAALVEFALVAIFLFTLVLGIINFGYLLSFKQDLTRAAAEGARAGAVAASAELAQGVAQDATDEAVGQFNKSCGAGGLTCTIPPVFDCDGVDDPNLVDPMCVEVTLTYDYKNHPLLPDLPIISAFLPNTLEASSVARVNE